MISISQPQIGKEEIKAAEEVLLSGRLAQGPKVKEFEERFAAYVGARYGVAVGNGTQALHLALIARGVGDGELVVTTPFTFAATATAILMCGAKPYFVDVEEDGNCHFYKMCSALRDNSKAMIPVHLYGKPIGAGDSTGKVVFDACQAHGAAISGVPIGALGTSCWSFYATKNMTTGEGGMITTNDEAEAAHLGSLRNHGMSALGGYDYSQLGYNYRMTEIQAAIGLAQLEKLPTFHAKRQYNATYLSEGLQGIPGIILPSVCVGITHAWHQYTIKVTYPRAPAFFRDDLLAYLNINGVGARVYYSTPLHKTTLFKDYYDGVSFPVAEQLSREVLSLPVHPGLSDKDLDTIIELVKRWANEY